MLKATKAAMLKDEVQTNLIDLPANPRCHTIFLPSVQTPSVLKQLKTERDIDQVFDLLAILRNKLKRIEFLEALFKFRLREKI
jgi:hypothetical protein